MAKGEFQLMRNLAAKYGVATPESSEDLYTYSFISSAVRAARRYGEQKSEEE